MHNTAFESDPGLTKASTVQGCRIPEFRRVEKSRRVCGYDFADSRPEQSFRRFLVAFLDPS